MYSPNRCHGFFGALLDNFDLIIKHPMMMKTRVIFLLSVFLLLLTRCEERDKSACDLTKWDDIEERTVEVRVKLPPNVKYESEVIPITDFNAVDIFGTINKEYCSGQKSGYFDIANFVMVDISSAVYYTVLPRVNYKFENDNDKVQVAIKLKCTLPSGVTYESTEDYLSFKPDVIYFDVNTFYYYVNMVITETSVAWTKK
jgi:hypothetical protein